MSDTFSQACILGETSHWPQCPSLAASGYNPNDCYQYFAFASGQYVCLPVLFFFFKILRIFIKMSHTVKVPATKPDNLNLILGTHRVEKTDSSKLPSVLHGNTHTSQTNILIKNIFFSGEKKTFLHFTEAHRGCRAEPVPRWLST